MADRKPLLVLAVLALVAIVIFGVGAVGAGRGSKARTWPAWASPQSGSRDQLTTADLRGGSSCTFAGATITFVGGCTIDVRPVMGGFPWQRVTRRAKLTAGSRAVGLTVSLADKTLHTDLSPGDSVRLTYTREAGTLALTCATPTGCQVTLAKDS